MSLALVLALALALLLRNSRLESLEHGRMKSLRVYAHAHALSCPTSVLQRTATGQQPTACSLHAYRWQTAQSECCLLSLLLTYFYGTATVLTTRCFRSLLPIALGDHSRRSESVAAAGAATGTELGVGFRPPFCLKASATVAAASTASAAPKGRA
jgi:hypothetical protein